MPKWNTDKVTTIKFAFQHMPKWNTDKVTTHAQMEHRQGDNYKVRLTPGFVLDRRLTTERREDALQVTHAHVGRMVGRQRRPQRHDDTATADQTLRPRTFGGPSFCEGHGLFQSLIIDLNGW